MQYLELQLKQVPCEVMHSWGLIGAPRWPPCRIAFKFLMGSCRHLWCFQDNGNGPSTKPKKLPLLVLSIVSQFLWNLCIVRSPTTQLAKESSMSLNYKKFFLQTVKDAKRSIKNLYLRQIRQRALTSLSFSGNCYRL